MFLTVPRGEMILTVPRGEMILTVPRCEMILTVLALRGGGGGVLWAVD